MICIKNHSTNPYFNLAAEEYILKNFSDDCFMLWRNKSAIVVGKHQNTLAEINYEFVKEHNIDVVRRLSGGGTVFHDLGNLNFTFIENAKDEKNLVDFKKYTKPILEVLHSLGVDAKFEGRNDIMIKGKKISGNAEHLFKKRVLHHGTLLFSSEIANLSQALKVNPLKYQDKGVKSVRSRVTNISEHLNVPISVMEFHDKIFEFIQDSYPNVEIYEYSSKDIKEINKLVEKKYNTWEWNYGYSPKYSFEKTIKTSKGVLEFKFTVEKGLFKEIEIISDDYKDEIEEIKESLIGIEHRESSIQNTLQKYSSYQVFQDSAIDTFAKEMF